MPLNQGRASGTALVLSEPLSFWGGVNDRGTIVDVHHAQLGASVTRRVLFLPSGRGSSSSSSCLAELIRTGQGPAGIVLGRRDSIIALGAIVAAELYSLEVPVVVIPWSAVNDLAAGSDVEVCASSQEAIIRSR
ncbi:aconitase X swivel domain-containing protein [Saccharopolyspora phatthalungensis]|uniref:aconitase X swivel domain-containing protein n=1 Tax=Saccharopolyspora phatthalungensis TaxID=664693 RepID=UPI0035E45229